MVHPYNEKLLQQIVFAQDLIARFPDFRVILYPPPRYEEDLLGWSICVELFRHDESVILIRYDGFYKIIESKKKLVCISKEEALDALEIVISMEQMQPLWDVEVIHE